MSVIQLESYSNARLQPKIRPSDARTQVVQLGPSLTVDAGDVLGKKTSDGLFYPVNMPNRKQVIKIAGTLSGGTWRISAIDKDGKRQVTNAIAYNANAATIATALNAVLGASAVSVAIPTDYATGIEVTFSGTGYAGLAQELLGVQTSALTGATTSSVEDGTTYDGTEDGPFAFNIYPCVTDADGNVYLSDSAVASSINIPHQTTQVYETGTFDPDDLSGLTTAIVKAMGGRYDLAGNVCIPN